MSSPWNRPRGSASSEMHYLLLHSQQACMRRFSESATFPTPASTPVTTEMPRPSFDRRNSDGGHHHHHSHFDQQIPADPEGELYAVTLDIKNTLTRLLNQEPVQHNDSFRRWTQERLMDSERDLKEQRRLRRRGSDTSVDAGARNSVGSVTDPSPHGSISSVSSVSSISDVNVRPPLIP